jgi:hypothetical protein
MGRFWRMSVVVMVLALAPMQAWGECAWVLWNRFGYGNAVASPHFNGGGTWQVTAALPDYASCNAAARQHAHRWAQDVPRENSIKVTQMIGGGFQAHADSKEPAGSSAPLPNEPFSSTSEYRCFPDTIDPRGPKGSGR